MTDVCKTSWETRVLAGEPSATIRVDNISTLYKGPDDAWGRPRRPQPLSVSLEIFLAKPFDKTSAEDAVESDTVHYGELSKSVQSKLEELKEIVGNTLFRTLETLWGDLTGVPLSGMPMLLPPIDPFLKNGSFKYLTVTMSLPKASAVGDGVSITRAGCMGDLPGRRPFSVLKATSSVLRIHGLRVPTLIGINANERERKQTLIANVEIENWLCWTDEYCAIEAVVTEVMENSSFGTLETLLHAIASSITVYMQTEHADGARVGWGLRISLVKPIAVPFADAPCVSLSIHTNEIHPYPER